MEMKTMMIWSALASLLKGRGDHLSHILIGTLYILNDILAKDFQVPRRVDLGMNREFEYDLFIYLK